jgi:hypothetical protein
MPNDTQFVDRQGGKTGSKITINEREDFFAALERAEELVKGETPRGKVLIYVAAIERSLQDLIRHVLVPSNQKEDSLLGGALNNFGQQIDLAHRIGVISQRMWRDLHVLDELRDDCMNRIENFSFEHSAIKSSVSMLERNLGKHAFTGLPVQRMDSEDKFSFIARTFLIILDSLKQHKQAIPEATKERFYKDD